MSKATLEGKLISLEEAYRKAAEILSGANFPLIAGLGADIAGARSAILLAERVRGAFDHLASQEILADLDVMRSFSMFTTTPNEARVRADCFLFVGPGLTKLWPSMLERLAPDQAPRHGAQAGAPRKIFWLGPEASEAADVGAISLNAPVNEINGLLAQLRATLGGRLYHDRGRACHAAHQRNCASPQGGAFWRSCLVGFSRPRYLSNRNVAGDRC